jgi:mono/diheme cytochrome c family protein
VSTVPSRFLPLALLAAACAAPPAPETPAARAGLDFARDILPVVERNCSPCHLPGGEMHGRMPLDDADTVRSTGEKLLPRIPSARDQELVRRYLAQEAPASAAPPGAPLNPG